MSMILIHQHLGLGDHFICAGLIRKLVSDGLRYSIGCKYHNFKSVSQLFSDLDNLEVICVDTDVKLVNEYHKYGKVLRIGFENLKMPEWEKSFYDQLDINYQERQRSFKIPHRNKDIEEFIYQKYVPSEPYALLCNSSSIGTFDVKANTHLPVIRLEKATDNILDWLKVIENAYEIHTVDTSFLHLIINMDLNIKKCYYSERQSQHPSNIPSDWNIINLNKGT